MTTVSITFRPHLVNGWWLRRFTDPYVEVDGQLHAASWTSPTEVEATAGEHELRTFVRYRHLLRGDGGAGTATVTVPAQGTLHVAVSNGMTNGSPFVARVRSAANDD